jgi:hypothetical protein
MNNENNEDKCEIDPSSPDIAPKDEPETVPVLSEQPKELTIGSDIAIEKIIEIFPKSDEPIDKIRITDIGLYSITKKNEAFFITNWFPGK